MSLLLLFAAGSAETFTSTATFTQAAGGWAATATETFAASATWTQAAASWSATDSEAFGSSATWSQAAGTWSAAATTGSGFSFSAGFSQAAAAWSASASGVECDAPFDDVIFDPNIFDTCEPVTTPEGGHRVGHLGRLSRTFQIVRPIPEALLTAAFEQEPAGWLADTHVTDDELVLVLA
jgi:hypothetical protein